jgi:hypothetical protein
MRTGNAWSDKVINPYKLSDWDGETIPIGEICKMIFDRDISISTTDEDNLRLDELEKHHEHGPSWEE